jgi:predicted metal-dependent phosphoesterase TrpH
MPASPAHESAPFRAVTQEAQKLKDIFQSVNPESCPKTYNFHMHTHCSDGRLSPEELMAQATDLGLTGLAITDHHTVKGYLQAHRWMEDWRWRNPNSLAACNSTGAKGKTLPRLWTGVEINAQLLDIEVHILGYGFKIDHPALQAYLHGNFFRGRQRQAQAVIEAIQSAGGLAVLAHPARYRISAEKLIPAAAKLGIDGVETYYAYENPDPWRTSPKQTAQVKALAEHYNLLGTCGTDTHGTSLMRRL